METAAPAPARRRRGLRRALWLLAGFSLGLPLLVFGLGNLWLASDWGRGCLAARITAATTLEASIGGASWSPWNGATLRDLRIEQPTVLRAAVGSPLLEVAILRARPAWLASLRGRLTLAELDLQKPRIVLPVQLLTHFARDQTPAAEEPAPDSEPEPETQPAPEPQEPPLAALPPPAPPDAAPGAIVTPAPLPADPRPTTWLRIRDGSFKLVTATMAGALIEVPGINGDLPIAGGPAGADIAIGRLEILGQALLPPLQAPLIWQEPVLKIGPVSTGQDGMNLNFAARIARAGGLPLQVELQIPEQAFPGLDVAGGRAEAGQIAADFRFRGLLLAPTTWESDFITRASDINLALQGQPTHFGIGGCLAVLRRGVISCVDARLIGDDLSFLANGTILHDGRAAAVLRIVSAPETATNLSRRLLPGIDDAPAFTELSTPQRVALDLEAFGRLGELDLRFGREGAVVGFQDALTPPTRSP
jgi:hypothetical protein